MADDKKSDGGGGGSIFAEFGWFFIGLAVLFIAWWLTGGPERASKNDKFVDENQGLQSGNTYNSPITIFGQTF